MTSGPKGGPLEKKFFKHVFIITKWLFWWKKTYFQYFVSNLKHRWKCFKTDEKKFKGWLWTRGGPLEKKFCQTCFYHFKMIVLMKENVFCIISKQLKQSMKSFQNWSKKNLRGDHQDQRGDHWKKIFFKHVFIIRKWLFWWKKTYFQYFQSNLKHRWKFFKTGRKKI